MAKKVMLVSALLAVSVLAGVACSDEGSVEPVQGASAGTGGPTRAGASGGGAGGADASDAPFEHRCTSPVSDARSGLVKCAEGYSHRPAAQACGAVGSSNAGAGAGGASESTLPKADGTADCAAVAAEGFGGAPAACEAFRFGYCKTYSTGVASSVCLSGCERDADCDEGFICVCDEPNSPTGGACHPSNCAIDDACGPGSLCASYGDAIGSVGFACLKPDDECEGSKGCGDPDDDICIWNADDDRRTCDGIPP